MKRFSIISLFCLIMFCMVSATVNAQIINTGLTCEKGERIVSVKDLKETSSKCLKIPGNDLDKNFCTKDKEYTSSINLLNEKVSDYIDKYMDLEDSHHVPKPDFGVIKTGKPGIVMKNLPRCFHIFEKNVGVLPQRSVDQSNAYIPYLRIKKSIHSRCSKISKSNNKFFSESHAECVLNKISDKVGGFFNKINLVDYKPTKSTERFNLENYLDKCISESIKEIKKQNKKLNPKFNLVIKDSTEKINLPNLDRTKHHVLDLKKGGQSKFDSQEGLDHVCYSTSDELEKVKFISLDEDLDTETCNIGPTDRIVGDNVDFILNDLENIALFINDAGEEKKMLDDSDGSKEFIAKDKVRIPASVLSDMECSQTVDSLKDNPSPFGSLEIGDITNNANDFRNFLESLSNNTKKRLGKYEKIVNDYATHSNDSQAELDLKSLQDDIRKKYPNLTQIKNLSQKLLFVDGNNLKGEELWNNARDLEMILNTSKPSEANSRKAREDAVKNDVSYLSCKAIHDLQANEPKCMYSLEKTDSLIDYLSNEYLNYGDEEDLDLTDVEKLEERTTELLVDTKVQFRHIDDSKLKATDIRDRVKDLKKRKLFLEDYYKEHPKVEDAVKECNRETFDISKDENESLWLAKIAENVNGSEGKKYAKDEESDSDSEQLDRIQKLQETFNMALAQANSGFSGGYYNQQAMYGYNQQPSFNVNQFSSLASNFANSMMNVYLQGYGSSQLYENSMFNMANGFVDYQLNQNTLSNGFDQWGQNNFSPTPVEYYRGPATDYYPNNQSFQNSSLPSFNYIN